MRGTSVKRTTDLATGANNNTVSFDSEEYDDDNIWTVSDPTKIGPVPASYNGKRAVFYACAIWNSDAGGTYREMKIFKNGDTAAPIWVVEHAPNAANPGLDLTSRPYVLATGDYFELVCRSGNAQTVLAASDYSIRFAIEVRTT